MVLNKHYISWEIFHKDVLELSKKIAHIIKKEQIKGIVTITRGALVPSAIIANEFNIRKIEAISLKSYDKNQNQCDIEVLSLPYEALKERGNNWIIIDELVDTGNTLAYIENLMPKALFFSVYLKEIKFPYLKSYVKSFSQDTWLVFPWEKDS